MKSPPIYVEIRIRCMIEDLWSRTQTPEEHARWDLRFTEIVYLPKADPSEPQRFLYTTRIGLGISVSGTGESTGSYERDGTRSSALRFGSTDRRSLILEGSGYWKYVPTHGAIRFLTQYSYQTRYGRLGHVLDRLLFRRLIGWATAWSFDSLRLWLETGQRPEESVLRSLVHGLARTSLALIWVFQGLVPKLLRPDTGEIAIIESLGLFAGFETIVVVGIGLAEIMFGVGLLWWWRSRKLFLINIAALLILAMGALISRPSLYLAPINPFVSTVAMIALGMIGYASSFGLPSSAMTIRKPPEGSQ